MVMVADFLPGLKRFFGPVAFRGASGLLVFRMVIAFILHAGRMSCLAAAGAVRSEPLNRAQITRFLRRPCWRVGMSAPLVQALLEKESAKGRFVFILDATLCGHAGGKTAARSIVDDQGDDVCLLLVAQLAHLGEHPFAVDHAIEMVEVLAV